ncbi:hypothetical protein [Kitasatospora sp. NPDC057015]|uniref:hypothetical protein n=1 Tax=Kitasatospora sp. NPDC057015 TaxID=3346001 RepID=UPI003643E32D
MTPAPTIGIRARAGDLVAGLVEESEQVQALARSLDLPLHSPDPARLLSRHLLSTLVHLACATTSAAAIVDLADPVTAPRLRSLARIREALSCLLSASGSMATVLDQLPSGGDVTDAAALVQGARLRGAALLTSASAHLGAAAGLLRTEQEPQSRPAQPQRARTGRPPGATMGQLLSVARPAVAAHGRASRSVVESAVRAAGYSLGSERLTRLMRLLHTEQAT